MTVPDVDSADFVQISDDLYKKCTIVNAKDGLDVAKRIQFPIMIKASEGGGGKGIRKVEKEEDFVAAFRQVQGKKSFFIFLKFKKCQARFLDLQFFSCNWPKQVDI